MSLSELSQLRRLRAEVAEIPEPNATDARALFRGLLDAAARYNSQVLRQTLVGKRPENPQPSETEAWQNELKSADSARRNAHEALISNYNALTRYCRKCRGRDLSIEAKYPPGAERSRIGDMSAELRRGIDQAKNVDEALFTSLTWW